MNGRTIRQGAEAGGILFKLLVLVTLIVVAGAIYLLRRPILRAIGGLLIVSEAPVPSDAIVVIGDDNFVGERAAQAAELFRERWAPRVVASGRYLRPYATIAELIARDLTEHGVPREAVVPFPHHGENTHDEAVALRGLLRERGWSRVIVVTSQSHTRRTRYIFRGVLGNSVTLRVVASGDAAFDPRAWWESRSGWKRFLYETAGMVVAIWEHWSDEDSKAPAARPAPGPSRSGWQPTSLPDPAACLAPGVVL